MHSQEAQNGVAPGVVPNNKKELKDQRFENDIQGSSFSNTLLIRPVAVRRHFKEVDFNYCTFDAGYFRRCKFTNCSFVGCRFVGTQLPNTVFEGCDFRYATFERTDIDPAVLITDCPKDENLKMRFARSLRMNFQQLGNAQAVNKAIAVELDATAVHLWKSWASEESYYRDKYTGRRRVGQFFDWLWFKVLDLAWGNGESTLKLLRAVLVVLIAIALVDVLRFGTGVVTALAAAPATLLGVAVPATYPPVWAASIVFLRLVLFGFFMSIVIKRFNRR